MKTSKTATWQLPETIPLPHTHRTAPESANLEKIAAYVRDPKTLANRFGVKAARRLHSRHDENHLHVGTHKTGTTSLQGLLRGAARPLARHGAQYITTKAPFLPRAGGRFDPGEIARQLDAAQAQGITNLILSSEGLSNTSATDLARLRRALAPHKVIFVLTLRHWSGYLPSMWKQNCKRYDTQSFPAFLDRLRTHTPPPVALRYDQLVDRLLAADPDGLRIVSYDVARGADGVLPAMLRAFDLDALITALPRKTSDLMTNRGASIRQTDLCRILNGVLSEARGTPPNEMFEASLATRRTDLRHDLMDRALALPTEAPALHRALTDALARTEENVLLSPPDPHVEQAIDRLESVHAPHLFNASNGRLFPDATDTRLTASTSEVTDLSDDLKKAVLRVIGRRSAKAAFSGILRRFGRRGSK